MPHYHWIYAVLSLGSALLLKSFHMVYGHFELTFVLFWFEVILSTVVMLYVEIYLQSETKLKKGSL